jgi:hypothetical protein
MGGRCAWCGAPGSPSGRAACQVPAPLAIPAAGPVGAAAWLSAARRDHPAPADSPGRRLRDRLRDLSLARVAKERALQRLRCYRPVDRPVPPIRWICDRDAGNPAGPGCDDAERGAHVRLLPGRTLPLNTHYSRGLGRSSLAAISSMGSPEPETLRGKGASRNISLGIGGNTGRNVADLGISPTASSRD